jgi:hypothetical protein
LGIVVIMERTLEISEKDGFTKKEILDKISNLVSDAKLGDSLCINISGNLKVQE